MDDGQTTPFGSPPSQAPSDAPPDSLSGAVEQEICQYVAEELARFGRAGQPRISGDKIQIHAGPHVDQWSLGPWAHRWSALDEPTRRLRAAQTARQLSSLRPAARLRPPSPLRRVAVYFSLAAVAIGGAFTVWRWPASEVEEALPKGVDRRSGDRGEPVQSEGDSASRAARVCRATLERVVRGATVTLADSEGWVVQYRALRPRRATAVLDEPSIAEFFSVGAGAGETRLIWRGEPELQSDAPEAAVTLEADELLRDKGPPLEEFVVTFSEPLSDAYFRERSRPQFFHLAAALTRGLAFDQAALYGRCAQGSTHHLGAWFAGTDHHLATSALMYSMGTFASPPHLSPAYYQRLGEHGMDHGYAYESISRVTGLIDRKLLAGLVGRQGGMVMGRPGELTTITFPFDDGNRASRLSREIARESNLTE